MVHNEYMQELISKYNHWWDVRNTYEGDELWNELYDEYGPDILDTLDDYESLKDGEAMNFTAYFAKETGLIKDFFIMMENMGLDKFAVNTREAFFGRADYFFSVIRDSRVKLLSEQYKNDKDFAIFQIV